jgi:protein O-GlcNAc transferase
MKQRLLLLPQTADHKSHYALYNKIDVALDCFPYAGTTTTVEALFMGVPVITLRKSGPESVHAHNVGCSLLTQAGLGDTCIANDLDDFVAKAQAAANDICWRTQLREGLRQTLLDSPLCDAKQHTSNLHAAYRDIWRSYVEAQGIKK